MAKGQTTKHQKNLDGAQKIIKVILDNCNDFIPSVTSGKISTNRIKKRGINLRTDGNDKNIHLQYFNGGGKQQFYLVLVEGKDIKESIIKLSEVLSEYYPTMKITTPYDKENNIEEVNNMDEANNKQKNIIGVNNKHDENNSSMENLVLSKELKHSEVCEITDNNIVAFSDDMMKLWAEKKYQELTKAELQLSKMTENARKENGEWNQLKAEYCENHGKIKEEIKKLQSEIRKIKKFIKEIALKICEDTFDSANIDENIQLSLDLSEALKKFNELEEQSETTLNTISSTDKEISDNEKKIEKIDEAKREIERRKQILDKINEYLRKIPIDDVLRHLDLDPGQQVTVRIITENNHDNSQTEKVVKEEIIANPKEGYFDYSPKEVELLKNLDKEPFGPYALIPRTCVYLIQRLEKKGFKKSLLLASLGKGIKQLVNYVKEIDKKAKDATIKKFYNGMCEYDKVINGRFKTLNFISIENYIIETLSPKKHKTNEQKHRVSFHNGTRETNFECE